MAGMILPAICRVRCMSACAWWGGRGGVDLECVCGFVLVFVFFLVCGGWWWWWCGFKCVRVCGLVCAVHVRLRVFCGVLVCFGVCVHGLVCMKVCFSVGVCVCGRGWVGGGLVVFSI